VHVYINSDRIKESQILPDNLNSIDLKVPGLSQMTINHICSIDLCSPISTTAVTRYLSNDYTIDPVNFAEKVWDSEFDIFGNWVFNVAQASTYLGCEWSCWIERLNGFDHIYQCLIEGSPVVISVRGPLTGSARPYAKGHLLVVIGYDSANQKVICMDPAFPQDTETHVFYDLSDLIQAWNRRGNISYIFKKNSR
jgi:hypothetical protein